MTAPRDVIAHSQFGEPTRDLLLSVYDRLKREYGMDEDAGIAAVDVLLALAAGGERSETVLLQKAAPAASRGMQQDIERQDD